MVAVEEPKRGVMPHLSYDANSMPTPEEFRKALREMEEQYDPVGDLLYMQRELTTLEQKYGVSSEECYRLFYEGKMGDDADIIWWVGLYRGFTQLKSAISEALEMIAVEPQAG
jgi:hypothetical protein